MGDKRPNFLIIGAARAGTTSLYYYLKQHPEIYMSPRKEPRFFAFEGRKEQKGPFGTKPLPPYSTSWEEYLKLFRKAGNEKVIGEASTIYLYHPEAPERIKRYIGTEVKMVAILRNPIERALSHYMYNVRRGAEPYTSFEEAIAKEEERIKKGWAEFFHYKAMGLYGEQIQRYFNTFGKRNLRVFLYEDFKRDPLSVVKEIFGFLNIDPNFVPDTSVRYNPSGETRIKLLPFLIKMTPTPLKKAAKVVIPEVIRLKIAEWEMWRNVKPLPKPKISPKTRRALLDYYREDILTLQELLGRDLSHWLEGKDE